MFLFRTHLQLFVGKVDLTVTQHFFNANQQFGPFLETFFSVPYRSQHLVKAMTHWWSFRISDHNESVTNLLRKVSNPIQPTMIPAVVMPTIQPISSISLTPSQVWENKSATKKYYLMSQDPSFVEKWHAINVKVSWWEQTSLRWFVSRKL